MPEEFSITVNCDSALMESLLPSLNRAMDDGLLSYEEAEQILIDECVTLEVEEDA